MTTGGAMERVTSVPGELHYPAPGSTVLRRFTAPGASINTGSYASHVVPIRDGRPVQDTFELATQRFEIVPHRSAVGSRLRRAVLRRPGLPAGAGNQLLAGVQPAAPGLAAGAL